MMGVGTPSPETKVLAPSSIMTSQAACRDSGRAVSRSTPKGLSVSSRTRRIWTRISSGPALAMPRQPKPPASETAAVTSA